MEIVTIIVALVLAFIAFKVLAGLLRVGAFIALALVVFLAWQQGVIA